MAELEVASSTLEEASSTLEEASTLGGWIDGEARLLHKECEVLSDGFADAKWKSHSDCLHNRHRVRLSGLSIHGLPRLWLSRSRSVLLLNVEETIPF